MDNKVTKKLKDITNEYWKWTDVCPEFVNNKLISHNNCRTAARDIFNHLFSLFDTKFLSNKIIEDKFTEMVNYLNDMRDLNWDIADDYYSYFRKILTYYEEKVIDIEAYEPAQNINKFLLMYKLNDAISEMLNDE